MSCPRKQVRTLHERLKITEEVEKNPTKKWIDIAKSLGLAPSSLNSIVAKKREIREQIDKCSKSCKKRKTGRESTFRELKSILLAWYQQVWASGIPIDGNILREKAKKISDKMQVDNFAALNGWICRFKDHHCLVYKKVAGESAAVNTDTRDLWLQRLPMLLERYEPWDTYNADETGSAIVCEQ
jgi:hypothetical protein